VPYSFTVEQVVDEERDGPVVASNARSQVDEIVGGQLGSVGKDAGRERTADGVGTKRQQVQGAKVLVANLRKTRPDVLVGTRDVGERAWPCLPLVGRGRDQLESWYRRQPTAFLDARYDADVAPITSSATSMGRCQATSVEERVSLNPSD
jgi:hypothetical protein